MRALSTVVLASMLLAVGGGRQALAAEGGSAGVTHAVLLKNAIVARAILMAVKPELEGDQRTAMALSNIGFAARLFEVLSSPSDLEVLGSLVQYNLGADGTETLECVILSKGRRIRPALVRQQRGGPVECRDAAARLGGVPGDLCLNDREFREEIARLLKLVDRGKSCDTGESLDD